MWEYEVKVYDTQNREVDLYDTVKGIRIRDKLETAFDTLELEGFYNNICFIDSSFIIPLSKSLPKDIMLQIEYASSRLDYSGKIVLLKGSIMLNKHGDYFEFVKKTCGMCGVYESVDYDIEEKKYVCKRCLEVLLYESV